MKIFSKQDMQEADKAIGLFAGLCFSGFAFLVFVLALVGSNWVIHWLLG